MLVTLGITCAGGRATLITLSAASAGNGSPLVTIDTL